MLQHTYERALWHSPPEKILVVITEGQQRWAFSQLPDVPTRNFIIQPCNLDTGPAISLAVAHVMGTEPQASLVMFPTDHFIYPEDMLRENVDRVLPLLNRHVGVSAVLLGARPTCPSTALGWIQRGKEVKGENASGLFHVERFVEKPRAAIARRLYQDGALWNTFILAGKAGRIWYLLWKRMPETMACLSSYYRDALREGGRARAEEIFANMLPFNFSTHVLQREPRELLVTPLEGVTWNDWGTADGVRETLETMGWQDRIPERVFGRGSLVSSASDVASMA
jgi:mannose-1-phosphate guanylyltransferase